MQANSQLLSLHASCVLMSFFKQYVQELTTKRIAVFLFVFTFLTSFFLIQGIPFFMYGHDDFSMAWTAKHAEWSTLFQGLFFQRVQLNENMYFDLGGRTTYFVFYKLLMALDGMKYPEINFLFRIILFSGSSVLLFYILQLLHVNKFLAFGGTLMYVLAVPSYSVLDFIGDLTLYSHFFMFIAFYLYLAKYREQPKTNPLALSISIFLISVIAIKSKQIAIIIPPVLFLHSLIAKRMINGALRRTVPFFSVLLLLYLPSPYSSTVKIPFNDLLFQFKTYYFYNPATRIGAGEAFSLVHPVTSYMTTPGSLFGIYKFFLGWIVLIMLLFFIILICKNYKKMNTVLWWPQFSFIFLWHVSEIALMTAYFQEHLFEALRYVGIAVPSFIALTFFCTQQTMSQIRTVFVKRLVYTFFVIALVLSITSNYYSSAIEIRGGLLSRHTLIHDSIYVVHKDYFKKADIDDTIFFRIFHWMDNRTAEEQLSQITFTNLATEFGQDYNYKDISLPQQKLKENDFIYILTFKSDVPFTNKVLLKKLSACPPESSMYCYFKDLIKGQNVFFYVFKVFKEP